MTWHNDPPAPPVVFFPKPITLFVRSSLHSSFDGRAALTGLSSANKNMTNRKKLTVFIFFIALFPQLSFKNPLPLALSDIIFIYQVHRFGWSPEHIELEHKECQKHSYQSFPLIAINLAKAMQLRESKAEDGR